ncbi:hypothetical protein SAMN05421785_103153 [Chryseobacterium gambrini]|uniref:Uncharacterized protein n=1 Tax=Chryseobacterium gambrini TaxID=373672 RepID=A0A1N7ME68_9FLAO|nr:hypothetical protein SAMN05421785_103153 [Chryseobacterium gambrini]
MRQSLSHLCYRNQLINKTLNQKDNNKFTKLISKLPDKTEENSGLGSRCFSSVFEGSLPKKNLRSASKVLTVYSSGFIS